MHRHLLDRGCFFFFDHSRIHSLKGDCGSLNTSWDQRDRTHHGVRKSCFLRSPPGLPRGPFGSQRRPPIRRRHGVRRTLPHSPPCLPCLLLTSLSRALLLIPSHLIVHAPLGAIALHVALLPVRLPTYVSLRSCVMCGARFSGEQTVWVCPRLDAVRRVFCYT